MSPAALFVKKRPWRNSKTDWTHTMSWANGRTWLVFCEPRRSCSTSY